MSSHSRRTSLIETSDLNRQLGQDMYDLISELYPICRSITGDGVRKTLHIIKQHIPLTVHEVPTGTKVFDWEVPKEWNINDAYIKNAKGEKIIDFKKSNLHVLNYSAPVKKKVSLSELKEHLFTLPEHPDWIPYRTSYYQENWGFCLSHNQFLELKDEEYEVFIDSSLKKGRLTYGEYYLEGETTEEVLISCHICHPSLCNDNLSGSVLSTYLAKHLQTNHLKHSFRFLFIPGTIGSITWLCLNEPNISKVKHGLVLACIGDTGGFTYKKSRQGNAEIDRAASNVLRQHCTDSRIIDFSPYGYDERQYCSPGFNLPVGCIMRTPHGEFPQYHTSADDLQFVKPDCLAESSAVCSRILHIIDNNETYINLNPKCEPQLGKRGLYHKIAGHKNIKDFQLAMLWVLNMSDGNHSLLDISDRSGLEFSLINNAADTLVEYGLLKNHSAG